MNSDLVIIGGGILGSATAFFASRAGLKPTLVEKRSSLAAHTTAKAVSCFRMQWDEPDFLYLMKNSIGVYENFAEVTGLEGYDIGLHQQGWLFASLQETGPARFQKWIAGQRALGVMDSELLAGDEACRRFPFLSPNVTAATFRAKDGWLSPYEVATGFLEASGANLLLDTQAFGIRTIGGRVAEVETSHGKIKTNRIVVCAGPHSKTFAEACGIALPVKLVRRQRAFIAAARVPPNAPMVADDDTGAYWRPEPGGGYLGWALGEAEQPPLDDVPADGDFAAIAIEGCARLAPFWNQVAQSLKASQVKVAAGQYSMTTDGKPLIGGAKEFEGLYFLTGDNGFGIEAGPQAARHLLRVMLGELSEADNPFRLDREMKVGKKMVL